MKKHKTLFVLHYSPPIHGASKVGDTIVNSQIINDTFNARFVKIKSANSLDEIGTFKFTKILSLFELIFKIIYQLIFFRPNVIYFTSSPRGFAFYRDIVIVIPIKVYRTIHRKCSLFYHYHAMGIYEFTKSSKKARILTNFLVKNSNIILISELMKSEMKLVKGYDKIIILNNGVPNNLDDQSFNKILEQRENSNIVNVLYLSNMMKEKGYDIALKLAKDLLLDGVRHVNFNFAGGWATQKDKDFFHSYIKEHDLETKVKYHGLVSGDKKFNLFSSANMFIFPTNYKKEVFPLSILEALSYGLPVLTFNKGAISKLINKNIGIITDEKNIFDDFNIITKDYLNSNGYKLCRNTFLENYTNEVFEANLAIILKGEYLGNCTD